MKTIEDTVIDIAKELFKSNEITRHTTIEDEPEWDSLNHLTFCMDVEDNLKIRIPAIKIGDIKNIDDMIEIALGLVYEKKCNNTM